MGTMLRRGFRYVCFTLSSNSPYLPTVDRTGARWALRETNRRKDGVVQWLLLGRRQDQNPNDLEEGQEARRRGKITSARWFHEDR